MASIAFFKRLPGQVYFETPMHWWKNDPRTHHPLGIIPRWILKSTSYSIGSFTSWNAGNCHRSSIIPVRVHYGNPHRSSESFPFLVLQFSCLSQGGHIPSNAGVAQVQKLQILAPKDAIRNGFYVSHLQKWWLGDGFYMALFVLPTWTTNKAIYNYIYIYPEAKSPNNHLHSEEDMIIWP